MQRQLFLPITMLYLPGRPQSEKQAPPALRGLNLLGMLAFSAAAWTLVIIACLAFWAGVYPVLS